MINRYSLIIALLFISVHIAPLCEGASPQPNNQPIQYAEISDADLSTPEKTTSSFVALFNMILPPSKNDYLQAICTKFALPSSHENCMKILESRRNRIKNLRNLKGASFGVQPPSQVGKSPPKVTASWQEILSFTDGSSKSSNKTMSLTLEKSGNEWKIMEIK